MTIRWRYLDGWLVANHEEGSGLRIWEADSSLGPALALLLNEAPELSRLLVQGFGQNCWRRSRS